MIQSKIPVAVVTGGNRGIGYEVCRQLAKLGLTVVLTGRNEEQAKTASQELQKEKLMVCHYQLDVADQASVDRLAVFVAERMGRLDALVNNAGVFLDPHEASSGALESSAQRLASTFDTNCIGAFRLTQALAPAMIRNGGGRVVNVSSGLGQLSEMAGGYPAYRISKAALNALTRVLADELRDRKVLVNSVCPGWVKTDMGGPDAERTVEAGADGIVWAATLPPNGPTGGFFRDRQPIAW
ncbi:MAG: SDR family oxidoreductase [Candidatus Wallbacteria bacterium]|nr:SDR family oxidoreductase [Candidatus Wallbacteria bacterium]